MEGQLCIVTGANAGIGKQVVKGLAKRGAHVVMVCRSEEKALAARQEVLSSISGGPLPRVDVEIADFSDLESLAALTERLLQGYGSVDRLINNAGAFFNERQLVKQGWERTFVTNHLAPMLLTERLVSRLTSEPVPSGRRRIINVASEAHHQVRRRTEDWHGEKGYLGFKAYGLSKLCNILYTQDLADRFSAKGVDAYSLHPGVIATDIGTKGGGLAGWIWKVSKPFMATVEKGARTPLFLATEAEVSGHSGGYFINCKQKRPSALAQDKDYREALMAHSRDLLSKWI